jgi:hypothetical protein
MIHLRNSFFLQCRPASARRHDIFKWWSRGELNPRPQAITGQFYMRSALI